MSAILKKYSTLRALVLREKAAIEDRLRQIEEIFAEKAPSEPPVAAKLVKVRRKRARNKVSLKAAVLEVTKGKMLTKAEILTAVEKLGYRFSTKNPLNSLGTVLYSGKEFKNVNGKFTAAK
jgi:hypothetical protein